jgi:hypothetical protein
MNTSGAVVCKKRLPSLRVNNLSVQAWLCAGRARERQLFDEAEVCGAVLCFIRGHACGTKIQGIFGAFVENTCIAAFHVLYIPLQLAAAYF